MLQKLPPYSFLEILLPYLMKKGACFFSGYDIFQETYIPRPR